MFAGERLSEATTKRWSERGRWRWSDGAKGRRRRSERAGEGMRLRATNGDGARGNESERWSERE